MPVNSRYDPSGKLTRGAQEHHRPEPLWRTGPAVPAPSRALWVNSPPAWYSPDRPTCSPASTERRSLWLRKPSPPPSVAIPTRQLSSPSLRVPSLPPNVSSWSDDSRLAVTSYLSSQLWPRVPSPDLPPVRPSLRGTVSALLRTSSQRLSWRRLVPPSPRRSGPDPNELCLRGRRGSASFAQFSFRLRRFRLDQRWRLRFDPDLGPSALSGFLHPPSSRSGAFPALAGGRSRRGGGGWFSATRQHGAQFGDLIVYACLLRFKTYDGGSDDFGS